MKLLFDEYAADLGLFSDFFCFMHMATVKMMFLLSLQSGNKYSEY